MSFPLYNVVLSDSGIDTTTINGRYVKKDGHAIGIASQKGVFLGIYHGYTVIILGKDGVARCVNKEFESRSFGKVVGYAVGARLLGVVDTIQMSVTGPILVVGHGATSVGTGLASLALVPAYGTRKGKRWCKICAKLCLTNAGSTVASGATTLLTPLEIIIPELNIKALKVHKWGPRIEGSDG